MTTTSITGGSDAGSRASDSTSTRRVFIEGFELIGRVGIYEHERRYEQRLVVSLDLEVADNYDGVCDELDGVYDYDHAIGAIRATVESRHFNLLETLAESIAQAVLTHDDVLAIKVRLAKPDVLIACRAVGIEIERRKG
jgi:7,8-dihydroneopterin aldolase/epimerase/oxygenase